MSRERVRGVSVTPGDSGSARLSEIEAPEPGRYECLIEVLEVGIDGTDREIAQGEYGEAPDGEKALVIGHESVGRVLEAPRGSPLGVREGDVVVATVRRPCPEGCTPCRNGQVDFCTTGNFTERGIRKRHGFFRERYAERPEYLVRVPDGLEEVAVWTEPISIVEKSFRVAHESRSMFPWEPRRLLVTGAGNLGILAGLKARLAGWEVQLFSRGPAEGARQRIIEATGMAYADAEENGLEKVVERFGAPHLTVEGTGFSPLAWQTASLLDRNGVLCLLGITSGQRTEEIASDALNDALVLGNRLVFGSVNADRRDFETGLRCLAQIRDRWPGVLEDFVTGRIPLDAVPDSLGEKDHDTLKTVVEVVPGGAGAAA